MSGVEVEPPVVIGVVGTHSTGKSTFLARLAHDLRAQGVQVATVADLGEEAQRRGLPMLFNHTWASTLWFITRGISQELEAWPHADVVLVDRAAPDALGYYLVPWTRPSRLAQRRFGTATVSSACWPIGMWIA